MIKKIYEKINNILSIYIFGNPNRFNYNIFNFFYRTIICKNNKKDEKINQFVKNGYFKGSKASKEFIDLIQKNIINKNDVDEKTTEFLNQNKVENKKKNISFNVDPSLRNKIIEFIKTDFKDDLLGLENYYNNKISIAEIQVKRNLPLENKEYYNRYTRTKEFEIYSNYYHVDAYVNTHIKMFINLQDVKEEDGPLHIYSKSSTRKFIKKNKYKNRQNYLCKELNELYVNSGMVGETLFANTTECLHRAGIPKENHHRDILFISFIVIPEKFDDNKSYLDYYEKLDQNSVWTHNNNNVVFKTKPKKLKDTFYLFKKYYVSKMI